MLDKILELAAQYGPFPAGIIIGIWIKRWSMGKYFHSTESEKKALREQIKELHDVMKGKEERISKLHDQLSLLSGQQIPKGVKK